MRILSKVHGIQNDHLSMQYKVADIILCTWFIVKYIVSKSSASAQNVFIIWFYVPAGFAHADNIKKTIYISIQYLYLTLKPVSRYLLRELVVQCVYNKYQSVVFLYDYIPEKKWI